MKMLRRLTLLLLTTLISLAVAAQDKNPNAADTMRSNGRIYVVVAVVLTILAGLLLYVYRLDRKITKLERES
jgi:hypothetical protein